MILQGRYTLCVLFEYAATLGMLDVGYTSPVHARGDAGPGGGPELISRYDGLRYVRLTALGRYSLGLDGAYRTPLPPACGSLRISQNLEITAASSQITQADKLVLDAHAAPVSAGVWRLERAKVLEAAEAGHPIVRFREFLAGKCAVPLPPSVEEFFSDCEDRAAALQLAGPALIVTCRDAALADRIAGDRRRASSA